MQCHQHQEAYPGSDRPDNEGSEREGLNYKFYCVLSVLFSSNSPCLSTDQDNLSEPHIRYVLIKDQEYIEKVLKCLLNICASDSDVENPCTFVILEGS